MLKNMIKKYSFQLIIAFWIVLFLILYQFNGLKKLDDNLQDQLLVSNTALFQPPRTISDKIVLIGIDENSTEVFGRFPWTRDIIAAGVQIISSGKPTVIGLDILFNEYTDFESGADLILAETFKEAGNVVLAAYGDPLYILEDTAYTDNIKYPIPELSSVSTVAHINTIPDNNVIRQTLNELSTDEGSLSSFAIAIYKHYAQASGITEASIEKFKKYEDQQHLTYFDYPSSPDNFTYYSFLDLFEEDFDPNVLKDTIVLVGPYAVGMQDTYLTPLNKESGTYGVAIWGIIIQNLINGTSIQASKLVDCLLILILGILISIFARRTSLLKGSITLLLLIGLFLLITNFAYSIGFRLSIIYSIILMVTIYLCHLVIKYYKEYKERKRITGVFGKYVAPQVVKKVLEEGEEALHLGGSRRFVTLLFVDIRGFTPMSEKATPEQVVEILNEYLTLCATSIINNEGTLDKFIGDATMAIYNAPINLENHALSAVKTALNMREGSLALEKKLEERFGRAVKFGIGINTGYAVIGNIGCHLRMDYTAIGDTVNTAARLESNAKPGQILISESTYELVKDDIVAIPLGDIKVKGKEQPVKIYQVEKLI